MKRLQIGDEVLVTAGSHKGNRGKVARLTNNGRVVVEGVNRVKRHMKATPQQPGGLLEVEAPIHASNVMRIDAETGKTTRRPEKSKVKKDKGA